MTAPLLTDEQIDERRERIKAFIAGNNFGGQCKMLSLGDACPCVLCATDDIAYQAKLANALSADIPKHLARRGLTEKGWPLADDDESSALSAQGEMPEEPLSWWVDGDKAIYKRDYDALRAHAESLQLRLNAAAVRLHGEFALTNEVAHG